MANVVVLVGRIVRDPEVRYTPSQTAVARFTVAVDRPFARDNEQNADFISCVAFGKSAEFIEKYFTKGKPIGLTGRIQTGSYADKNGNKVYTTDVVVEEQEFAESKAAASGNQGSQSQQTSGDGFMNVPTGMDEELPFN